MGTGEIEVQVNKFEVLNYAKERLPYLPFSKASEDVGTPTDYIVKTC